MNCLSCENKTIGSRHLCHSCAERHNGYCRGGCGTKPLKWFVMCGPCVRAGKDIERKDLAMKKTLEPVRGVPKKASEKARMRAYLEAVSGTTRP